MKAQWMVIPFQGPSVEAKKGWEQDSSRLLRKNIYHLAWNSKPPDSVDGTGLLLIQSTNHWSRDFFEYYSKSKMSNRTLVKREPRNWQVGSQSLRKMPPEVRRQKKSCVRMTWLSRAIGRTSQFWHFCHCILFAPPAKSFYFVSEWICPREERKYRALLSEEVFPCAAGWPGSAEEQNICHSSIEFRLGDIHQWIIPVLWKEEKYMKVQIPSKIKYSHVWLLKSASAHWIYLKWASSRSLHKVELTVNIEHCELLVWLLDCGLAN